MASNYEQLVKALRHCMTKEDGITICELCPYYGKGIDCEDVLHTDAAAAIEEMQAQLPKRGKWVETEEKEWGIYPFKKQTCYVCDCKIDHTFMLACMDYFDDRDTVFHYCPNCGADMRKMEVQE